MYVADQDGILCLEEGEFLLGLLARCALLTTTCRILGFVSLTRQTHLERYPDVLDDSCFRCIASRMFSGSSMLICPQLFGFSLAGSLALYYLNQEREIASGLLIASIDELQQSTGKASASVSFIPLSRSFHPLSPYSLASV